MAHLGDPSRVLAAGLVLLAGAFAGPSSGQVLGPGGLRLVENLGQWPGELAFVGAAGGVRVGLHREGGLWLDLRGEACGGEVAGAVVALVFEGASAELAIEGEEPLPGLHHCFLGNDPARWVRGARGFARARIRGLYEGIDLIVREGGGGALEYDLLVEPGADLAEVVVRCEGILDLGAGEAGGLVLETDVGPLVQPLGISWQERGGVRLEVALRYRVIDARRFGFEVDRDPALALCIDPQLVWSTYLGSRGLPGGASGDEARAVALDLLGQVTVVGEGEGPGFPLTPGSYQHPGESFEDSFVTRFRQSDGRLVFSSLIGGVYNQDVARAVAVDAQGAATVAGSTRSPDFPTTPGAFDTERNSLSDSAFVLRLSPEGDDLVFSTLLEGTVHTTPHAVAIASSGATLVAGETADGFPTTPGAFSGSFPGVPEGFVTRLDPTASRLEWSTLLGGSGTDVVYALVLDVDETVVVTGQNGSIDFPLTTSPPSPHRGVFVTRLSADGSRLVWSDAFGGSRGEVGLALAHGPAGSLVVGGATTSRDFPTSPGVFQESFSPSPSISTYDGFLALVKGTTGALLRATLLGGAESEGVEDVTTDASGVFTVTGGTNSADFPTTPGAFDTSLRCCDAYVARLDPSLAKLLYSTKLGTVGPDSATGIALNRAGRVTVVGDNGGPGFPTTPGALSPSYNGGGGDAFVTTMDLVLAGVEVLEEAVLPCGRTVQLNATEMPAAGAGGFAFYVSGAPPRAPGWLVVRAPDGGSGSAIPGISAIAFRAGAHGYAEIPLPLGSQLTGLRLRCRAYLLDPGCAEGVLAASNGLRITVQ